MRFKAFLTYLNCGVGGLMKMNIEGKEDAIKEGAREAVAGKLYHTEGQLITDGVRLAVYDWMNEHQKEVIKTIKEATSKGQG